MAYSSPAFLNGDEQAGEMLVDDEFSYRLQAASALLMALNDTICCAQIKYTKSRDAPLMTKYWRLSRRAISMFLTADLSGEPFEEILMENIINVEITSVENPNSIYVFVIRSPCAFYYVGDWSDIKDRALSLEWANQIRYWCVQSLTELTNDEICFDIIELYAIDPSKILGCGQFGVVYSAIDRDTGRAVAVKAIDHNRMKRNHLASEVKIPRNLNHPSIIKIVGFHLTHEKIYIVSELLHEDLLSLILRQPERMLSERLVKFLTYQLLCALTYLESQNVTHCDLKPENILLATAHPFPQIKLCDFGYSVVLNGSAYAGGSIHGSIPYSPPEVLNAREGEQPYFDATIDTWSTGVIIYICLTGYFPYNPRGNIALQLANEEFLFGPSRWRSNYSKYAKALIKDLLSFSSLQRRGVIKAAKRHAWFTDEIEQRSATYQFWCDITAFEERVKEEANRQGEKMRPYWKAELALDRKMLQLQQEQHLPTWQEIGCKLST